jgi:hypothetical protein
MEFMMPAQYGNYGTYAGSYQSSKPASRIVKKDPSLTFWNRLHGPVLWRRATEHYSRHVRPPVQLHGVVCTQSSSARRQPSNVNARRFGRKRACSQLLVRQLSIPRPLIIRAAIAKYQCLWILEHATPTPSHLRLQLHTVSDPSRPQAPDSRTHTTNTNPQILRSLRPRRLRPRSLHPSLILLIRLPPRAQQRLREPSLPQQRSGPPPPAPRLDFVIVPRSRRRPRRRPAQGAALP